MRKAAIHKGYKMDMNGFSPSTNHLGIACLRGNQFLFDRLVHNIVGRIDLMHTSFALLHMHRISMNRIVTIRHLHAVRQVVCLPVLQ